MTTQSKRLRAQRRFDRRCGGFAAIDQAAHDVVTERADALDLSVDVVAHQFGGELGRRAEIGESGIEADRQNGFLRHDASSGTARRLARPLILPHPRESAGAEDDEAALDSARSPRFHGERQVRGSRVPLWGNRDDGDIDDDGARPTAAPATPTAAALSTDTSPP